MPKTRIRPLYNHRYAQCHVIEYDNGDITLVSYRTAVCGVESGKLWCSGTYSQTTRKQMGWFARELGLTYFDFKAVVGK